MMMNTKSGLYNTWKYAFVVPVLFSAMVAGGSTNAFAQSKTVSTEIKGGNSNRQTNVKKDDAGDLIKDLVKEKVLSGTEKNLYVILNYNELLVNSKPMPEDLHKRMRAKYLGGNSRKTITYKVTTD